MTEKRYMEMEGACVCGKVRFKAQKVDLHAGACHCSTCRNWGGPYMAVDCGRAVEFENEDSIKVYDSSMWAERGFCSNCGSHLFYRLKESGQYGMSVGLFDPKDFEFDHQYFIDQKPAFYSFANKTNDLTGPELFAKFGAE